MFIYETWVVTQHRVYIHKGNYPGGQLPSGQLPTTYGNEQIGCRGVFVLHSIEGPEKGAGRVLAPTPSKLG